jgi:hypothetical protein
MNIVGGSIVWDLDVDDKKFTAKLSSAGKGAKEFSSGLDKESKGASKSLDGTANSLDNVTEKLKSIAKVAAGAFAVSKMIAFGKEAIQLSVDLEKAQISLGIIAERFGQSGDAANSLAKSLGSELRIGTGAASEALQNLVKQGFGLEQAGDLMRRFTNEAITGKSSSIDLATAVQNLSFAYATGNSALGNMSGISENFSDIQDKGASILEKWNGKAVAQGKISEEMATNLLAYKTQLKASGKSTEEITMSLEKYAGMLDLTNLTMGSSEKFAGTYGDNVLILEGRIRELKTSLGSVLTEALNPFVQKLADSVPTLDQINKFLQPLGQYFEIIAGAAIGALLPAIGGLVLAFKALAINAALALIPLLPYIIVGAAIGLAIKLLRDAWESNWGGIQEKTQAVVFWFQNTAWPILQKVFGFIMELVKVVYNIFAINWWLIKTAVGIVVDWFANTAIGKTLKGAFDEVKELLAVLGDNWSEVWDTLKDNVEEVFFQIKRIVKSGLNTVIGYINQIIGKANSAGQYIPGYKELNKIPELASGASNFTGGMALVGERGPELVNLPRGSDIYPAKQTSQMLGSGGATINIQEMIVRDDYDIDRFSEQIGFLVGIEPAIFEG